MPKSSSPSPSITPMNPIKTHPQTLILSPNPTLTLTHSEEEEDDLLRSYHLHPQSLLMDDEEDPEPDPAAASDHRGGHQIPIDSPFSSLLRDPDDEDDEEEAAAPDEDVEGDDDEEDRKPAMVPSPAAAAAAAADGGGWPHAPPPRVDPSPHISSQFYTFNRESHALMVRCILEGRPASPDEIRVATPRSVLASWRSVWKDRNEDTAYLTAWKRIQDKLHAHIDPVSGRPYLYFKNNPAQCVSPVDQWQDIVEAAHADPDLLRHLGLKETVDRIRQIWTVGAKFYGIPESFIRVCIASCPVCSSSSSTGSGGPSHGVAAMAAARSKRRRFEYTDSFDVPARDVPQQLQQLAHKHKVVLCIRQKYIRYKPFMAEVKDYACHRAGEPSSASAKKGKVLKREPYQSKRCGCAFRIRAIVPITNYNEKDKTFVYQEEGTAVFKLYAVHSGHEPGPLDGNARIIHRVVGQKGVFDLDPVVYGVREDPEHESFVNFSGRDNGDNACHAVLQQVQDIRVEAGLLEGRIAKMPAQLLCSLSRELSDILHRLRSVNTLQQSDEPLVVGDEEAGHWGDDHNHHIDNHNRMFGKDAEIIEEDETDFGSALRTIVSWDRMAPECQGRKMLMRESCKTDKWMMKEDCGDFDAKSILNCVDDEDSKLIKPIRHDGTIGTDSSLVGMPVDAFYPDNTKWYDSPGGLDAGVDSGDGGFRHEEIE